LTELKLGAIFIKTALSVDTGAKYD